MGLLDGDIQTLFGSIFGAIYLDGTLHHPTTTDDGKGGITATFADHAIKGMVDIWSTRYLSEYGIPQTGAVLIILQAGVPVAPTLQSRVTLRNQVWVPTAPIAQDPAQVGWIIGVTPQAVEEEVS